MSKCYNCQNRHIGCHSDCEDYKQFRAELDEINKQKEKDKALNSSLYAVKEFAVTHSKRRRKGVQI